MRLFYSIAVIAWAASCFGTPPPGYVKKPSTDEDPPAYEYKYEIGDGTGKGQGKAETRAGEFASGSYYVNTGDGATDVKYFADDWGYHPVVKYGTSFKHGSTRTRFALGEHAVKALRNGDAIGQKVKLPSDNGKRKSVQIIQPYTVEVSDPPSVTPTYPTSTEATPKGEELVQDSGESSSGGVEELGKESRAPSTTSIPPSSHSTAPESSPAAYTPESAAATPTQLAFTPLQELRNIYANNDYRNAALIDEQLYLQNSGSFGNKVQSFSSGESGIRVGNPTSSTTRRPYPLTKQNGDVTYTVHSSSNANTAYLSATGKRLQSSTSSTTEGSVIISSTSSELTRNDLAGEYPATDPRLVNYALAHAGLKETYNSETRENQELATPSSGARKTFGTFAKPIVVAELGAEYGTTCRCNDEATPTPVERTTLQPAYSIQTTTFSATPKAQSQNRGTTSSVILNPIQAGVALVHAGEAHLISSHEESRSRNTVSTSFKEDSEKRRVEEHQKRLEETVARIAEEIQLQNVQQKLELEREDYASQGVRLREKQREEERREDYRYRDLGEETRLKQEVELQQVEESRHNEQLEVQTIGQSGVEGGEAIVVHKIEKSNEEEGRVGSLTEGSYGTEKIRQAIEEQEKQDLEKYRETSSSSSGDSESVGDGDKIEIQKSIEIYHNTPVQEIHYPSSGRVAIEGGGIDDGSEVGQEYVEEFRSVDNTRGSYRGPELDSGLGVSLEFNQATGLREKDQFSLSAENQAQQVLLAGYPGLDQVLGDSPRPTALPQKILLEESSPGQYDYQKPAEEEQPRVLGIDHQIVQLQQVVLPENGGRGYQLNQREQSQSNSYSQADSYSYESNRAQQQQQQQQVGAAGLPYTLEASRELILPGISSSSVHHAVKPGLFNNYATISISEYFPISSGEIGFQQQQQQLGGNQVVEKTVHIPVETVIEKKVPLPVTVEKVVEKQVPYPVERVVERRIPIPQPYPVHIKVPHPYPVETIVEKPVKVHVPVPVTKLVEKEVPVPQPYPVEVEKIVEKKVPYPVEVIKYVDKPVPVHVPQPYPVERIVERPIQIRVPYAVEVTKNVPYGVQYGVSYQQIMRPHSHSLYINHGDQRPSYDLPVASRYQEFRQQGDSKQQLQGYGYENPAGAKFVEGNGGDQISAGNQQVRFNHFGASSLHQQQSSSCNTKFNPHIQLQVPHFSARRHVPRSSQDGSRNEEYIGPVPPQRSHIVRHHQVQQRILPQQSTIATRSPDLTTTFRRTREPEAKPQSSLGNFRQSRVEYGFKPPMIPSIQYDEETASKVES